MPNITVYLPKKLFADLKHHPGLNKSKIISEYLHEVITTRCTCRKCAKKKEK